MPRFALSVAVLCAALSPTIIDAQQDKFFDPDGVRLRYVEQGQGQPIILLHDNGNTLQSWIDAGVFPNLAADYRVIAFDARGHGKSGKPHDAKQYGSEMVKDVVRLLDHLEIWKAHIIGYSMGANTTAELLTTNPDRFSTAVLGAAAGRNQPWTDANRQATEQEAAEREKECISRSQDLRLAPTSGPKPTEEDFKRRSECFANPKSGLEPVECSDSAYRLAAPSAKPPAPLRQSRPAPSAKPPSTVQAKPTQHSPEAVGQSSGRNNSWTVIPGRLLAPE
jgi:pimeloyl-ACP methyl ester carboxylesterase